MGEISIIVETDDDVSMHWGWWERKGKSWEWRSRPFLPDKSFVIPARAESLCLFVKKGDEE